MCFLKGNSGYPVRLRGLLGNFFNLLWKWFNVPFPMSSISPKNRSVGRECVKILWLLDLVLWFLFLHFLRNISRIRPFTPSGLNDVIALKSAQHSGWQKTISFYWYPIQMRMWWRIVTLIFAICAMELWFLSSKCSVYLKFIPFSRREPSMAFLDYLLWWIHRNSHDSE